jgi:hypothetical protein
MSEQTSAFDTIKSQHPMVNIFPKIKDQEYESLFEDIKRKGVAIPVIVKDGVLYDGRNRYNIVKKLRAEGHEIDGKLIDLPVTEFQGTDAELVQMVESLNLTRRQLNPGQKAAIAVELDRAENKYDKEARESRKDEQPGDRADRLAKRAGSNRTYIFKATALYEARRDLFNKVKAGDLTLTKAEKMAAMTKNGEGGGEGEGEGEGGEGGEGKDGTPKEKKENVVLDGLGNEVTNPKLLPAFKALAEFASFVEIAGVLRKQLATINESAGGAFLPFKECDDYLKAVVKTVKQSKPYAPCKCKGRGCGDCHHQGYVNKIGYDAQQKAAAEKEATKEAKGAGAFQEQFDKEAAKGDGAGEAQETQEAAS